MAGISINLTPATIPSADYVIAQGPSLGMERDAYLTAEPFLWLGQAHMTATGVLEYEAINGQLNSALTGTMTGTISTTAVNGVGTLFTTEVEVGDLIKLGSEIKQVATVTSDTALVVESAWAATHTAVAGTVYPSWPIVAFVYTEVKADAAPVITLGHLSATLAPVGYAANQSFNFSASRGVEMTRGTEPTSVITTATVPTITNARRGGRIAFVQLPKRAHFSLVATTNEKNITLPIRAAKAIASGFDATRYVKPGRTTEGKLRITSKDLTDDDGLRRFMGQRCVAMIETKKEELVITSRSFLTNFVPGASQTNPDGDGESMIECEGFFQHLVTVVAG